MVLVNAVVDWRQKLWAGLKQGDRMAAITGRILVPVQRNRPPFWRTNRAQGVLLMSAWHMRPEYLRHYVAKLRTYKPQALECYPSTGYLLAQYVLREKDAITFKCVFTSSEALHPHQREAMEKAFSCPVFDFYGMAERVVFATECDKHTGHHLNSDYGITEFLGADGAPAPAGQLARIVGTSLYNYGMPMIRYVTSDVSALQPEACGCGRAFPLMQRLTSRSDDFLVTTDGRYMPPAGMTIAFRPIPNIVESQIVQAERSRVTVRVVRGPDYTELDTTNLLKNLKDRLGADMKIDLEFTEEIPRTRTGKHRWIISEVPLDI
jgi:phenylacetate-CoA ligase